MPARPRPVPGPIAAAPLLALLVAPLLAGLPACGGQATPDPTGAEVPATLLKVPVGASPVAGPSDAWVTVVTFSDFECPFCARVQPTLATVLPEFGADVRLVFKNFPLTSLHRNARAAALGAECAHRQGRFWAFHDLVFAEQDAVFGAADVAAALAAVAVRAGVDAAAWQACLVDPAADAAVLADMQAGARIHVSGTPTFVVNGVPVVGAQPAATFRAVIAAARDRARASGVPAAEYYEKVVLAP